MGERVSISVFPLSWLQLLDFGLGQSLGDPRNAEFGLRPKISSFG